MVTWRKRCLFDPLTKKLILRIMQQLSLICVSPREVEKTRNGPINMKQKYSFAIPVSAMLVVLSLSVFVARAAGGRIEGKVTDPKGAAVVGATVRVTESETNQTFTATSDAHGKYKIEGLTTGTYTILVSALGFSEARREAVKVGDGAAVQLDLQLEIAPLEAAVTVSGTKLNADPLYQQLRQQAKTREEFAGSYASVNNLSLTRDAATFTLRAGEIYFLKPIDGRATGAVFIGDGEMTLVPPTAIEKRSLAIFVGEEKLTEQFSQLVIRFTDKTFDEIKASAKATMGTNGPQAAKAHDLYRDNQQLLRKQLRDNGELRTLADLYAPPKSGYFNAFVGGKKYSKLIFLLDPLGIPFVSPEEVALISYGTTDGGIWTAFHLADEYSKGTPSNAEDHRMIDITHHQIDGTIKGAHLTATDVITFRALAGKTSCSPQFVSIAARQSGPG